MISHASPADMQAPEGPAREIGILTTDNELVITSWDAPLAAMTAISAADAVGRSIGEVVPDLEPRGLLALVREALESGAPRVLAPAFHQYFIPVAPRAPSARYQRMQQRVGIAPLFEGGHRVGLVVTVEDVTARLELEQQLAVELRDASPVARLDAIARLAALTPVEGLGPLPSAMADDDWRVRRSAVSALASRRDPALVDALVAALREHHRNFSVLSSALQLLTMTGVDLTASLVDLLHHPEADLRIQAALALGSQTRPDAIEGLVGALGDEDVNVRFHAIESLGRLRPRQAVEPLAAIAESHDFFLAFPALDALSRIDDASVAPRLVPLLGDELLGAQAAEALGEIGDEEMVAPLVGALESPHMPPAPVVEALENLHRRYGAMLAGGAAEIEDLVRASISPRAAERIIDAAERASGPALRQFVTVLGWLRGDDVARALARMLGRTDVQHELVEAIVRFGAPMVDRLLDQLNSGDTDTRRAAILALGRIGDLRAVPSLVKLLLEEDRELLVPATGALARLGDRRAYEPLVQLLGDSDVAVRQGAIGALNSIGHPEMSARMRPLLEDADPVVRESAVRIAGYFGFASCAAALIGRCADSDETVRAAALEHLGYLDDERILPVLLAALRDGTPRARAAAARSLAHVESPVALEALGRAIDDPDQWVRYFSVASLGRQANRSSLPLLQKVAAADEAHHVRIAAIAAIGAIGGKGDVVSVPVLASLVDDADEDLAVAAIRALGSVESASAVDPVRRALSAAQPARRAAAADALGRLGGASAIDALQWIAAGDSDADVTRAAIAGLSRMMEGEEGHREAAAAAIASVAADPERREEAIAALARASAAAIPHVAACLGAREPGVRRAVVEALGRLAHPIASAHLRTALTDDDASVRQMAVTVLSHLGTRGLTRAFAEIARADSSETVRAAAAHALQRLRRGDSDLFGAPDQS